MIIQKFGGGIKMEVGEEKFFLDPDKIYEGINILTDLNKNINVDKIFNLPGEYEVNDLFLFGYINNKNDLAFVFLNRFIKGIYFREELNEDLIKKINEEFGNLDIVIFNKCKNYDKIKDKLRPKVLITLDQKFPKAEKTKRVKINIKNIGEGNYILV
ncbi:MAG: hypothetical protein ACP5JU_01710 [Minisyncoccia bacterium]